MLTFEEFFKRYGIILEQTRDKCRKEDTEYDICINVKTGEFSIAKDYSKETYNSKYLGTIYSNGYNDGESPFYGYGLYVAANQGFDVDQV